MQFSSIVLVAFAAVASAQTASGISTVSVTAPGSPIATGAFSNGTTSINGTLVSTSKTPSATGSAASSTSSKGAGVANSVSGGLLAAAAAGMVYLL